MRTPVTAILLFLLIVPSAYAHAGEEASLMTVNGALPQTNPLHEESVTTSWLTSPHYIEAKTYQPNETITFALRLAELQENYPNASLPEVAFQWDFGDGAKSTGTTNTHKYQKTGSYTVSVKAIAAGQSETISNVQINIIPKQGYQLPQPKVVVKGQVSDGSLLELPLAQPIKFEAQTAKGSTIRSYQWDFGDGKKYEGKQVVYRYQKVPQYATPILRVTDTNGLQQDTFVPITASQPEGGVTFSTSLTGLLVLILEIGALFIGGCIFFFVLWQEKHKKH